MTEHPNAKKYDLFISYADADRPWVEGFLLTALTEAGVRWHAESAFVLGVPRILEFQRAVQESQRTLFILSPAYLAQNPDQFINLLAQSEATERGAWTMIPLILHPVKLEPRLRMLTRLDATDFKTWPQVLERLLTDLERPLPEPPEKPICPYPGMRPFTEHDSRHFFGRDREVRELLQQLHLSSFVPVIGPSGCGKSSLVFAGLVPALQRSQLFGRGGWLVRTVRLGATPLTALASSLDGDPADLPQAAARLLAGQPEAHRLLLVVDQFEELFTRAKVDAESFQRILLQLAETAACYVVLTVRADFYAELMQLKLLWPKIQQHRIELSPLDEAGLRQAIECPAENAGVFLEPRLVVQLVAHATGQPGCLPFLQEALRQLWDDLEWRFLPYRAYEALGDDNRTGLQVAMARHADHVLSGLSAEQQMRARRIFLRLVQFGKNREDIRCQEPVLALRSADDDRHEFDRTLEHLVHHRLLTISGEEQGDKEQGDQEQGDEKKVDIAHEALITGWPALAGWVTARREADLTRRRLEAKKDDWVRMGRGVGGLLDKKELPEVERWLAGSDAAELGYSADLKALVEASRTELRTQRLRQWFAVAAGLILVLVVLGLGYLGNLGYREWMRNRTATKLVHIDGGSAIIDGCSDIACNQATEPNMVLLPFEIEQYEVTNAQYRICVEFSECDVPENTDQYNKPAMADYPVTFISAIDAHNYCAWLGRRLPTAVEWERAARGDAGRKWPWGNKKEDYWIPRDLVPVNWDDEDQTPDRVFHLAYNVQEWVVDVTTNCELESCHQAWDGISDSIARIGRSPDHKLDDWEEAADAVAVVVPDRRDVTDPQIGFRCAAFLP